MSCSRHSSVIVLGPRSDASTISVLCCALSLRYFLISLNENSSRRPSSERPRTESSPAPPARIPLEDQSEKSQHALGVHAHLTDALTAHARRDPGPLLP